MSYSTRDVQRELRRRLGRDGYRAMTRRIRRDEYREERRRNAVPAPRSPWGEKYYKFWFDTGALCRRRPEAFDRWGSSNFIDARNLFELMWGVVIVNSQGSIFTRRSAFDDQGVAKDHAWLKFKEGWNSAYNRAGFDAFQRGMDSGPVDVRPYINRYTRLLREYMQLAPRTGERVLYRRRPERVITRYD